MCAIDIGNLKTRNSLTFPFAPNHVRHPPQTTGIVSAGPESQPSSSEAGTQLTAFSQIPKSSAHASGA